MQLQPMLWHHKFYTGDTTTANVVAYFYAGDTTTANVVAPYILYW